MFHATRSGGPRAALAILASVITTGAISTGAGAEPLLDALGGEITDEFRFEEARQYDFWIGQWRANWRYRQPDAFFNAPSSEIARHWVFPVLGGKALIELVRGEAPRANGSTTQGFSIRYFDTAKERWVMAQNWPAPNTSAGFLDQLQGFEEENRVQVFSAWIDQEGVTNVRRYSFSDISDQYFRWESGVTKDQGKTWSAGTIVHFHKTDQEVDLGDVGESTPDCAEGGVWVDPGFAHFRGLQGSWSGVRQGADGEEAPARLVATQMQNGGSVMGVVSYPEGEHAAQTMHLWTFGTRAQAWIELRLDNRVGSPHTYFAGQIDDEGRLVLHQNDALRIKNELEPRPQAPLINESPLARTVWVTHESRRLVYEDQVRASVEEDAWVTVARFEFEKED